MPRATQIFSFDERPSESPFADTVWRTWSEPFASFTSVAATHWEIVVVRQRGETSFFVRGPETRASRSPIPEDAEFFGIQFKLGTFMPHMPVGALVDDARLLPSATRRSFWLNGSAWEFPTYDNADTFLTRLKRKGLLARDPIVDAALHGRVTGLSLRTMQRRVLHATGLTHGAIQQIQRAERALALLERGVTILDAVALTGYADQSHMNRSLKRFLGHTPARIVRETRTADR
jgi:AraC-like DNA-binding protein